MPKIVKDLEVGQPLGLYDLLIAALADITAQKVIIDELILDHVILRTQLADISDKYADHRHSVAGAASTGTKPSTGGAEAEATASTIAKTLAALTAVTTALTVTS